MITLLCLGHRYLYETEQLVRMFFPGEKIQVLSEPPDTEPENLIITEIAPGQGGEDQPSVELRLPAYSGAIGVIGQEPGDHGSMERQLGYLLFTALQKATGTTPPWGILTGVRPVRLSRQWMENGLSREQVYTRFTRDYLVQDAKARLALDTADAQEKILAGNTPDGYSLYISIPFCPTRCLYCSFVSHAIDRAAKLIPGYIDCIRKELEATAEQATRLGLKLHTVYVGGGTPTSLSAGQLEELLACVEQHFDFSYLKEYTVEAGRPDTIDAEKLKILRKFGVGRISINPQTMDDTILRAIGRRHTAAQAEESYRLARGMGFSAVNMDLIAGLPGESAGIFGTTLDRVLALRPENITLHTLTVKRSSGLRERENAFEGSPLALGRLLGEAQRRFDAAGYGPYYLYRQKGTVQNLENTGFSLPGHEGIYNVYSMEEVHSILAVGAGAVTKLCRRGHIQRVCNFKYPYEYIGRFGELMRRKSSVEAFYEKHSGEEVHPR